jgi:hypothetical protein
MSSVLLIRPQGLFKGLTKWALACPTWAYFLSWS